MEIKTEAQYLELRARYDTYEKALRAMKGNGWACVTPADAKLLPPSPSNDERSAIEVWEFVHNPPARYFAYVSDDKSLITTWTGDKLGSVLTRHEWRDNWGGTRVSIRVRGINGRVYAGTWFKSAGDYCRIRKVKN